MTPSVLLHPASAFPAQEAMNGRLLNQFFPSVSIGNGALQIVEEIPSPTIECPSFHSPGVRFAARSSSLVRCASIRRKCSSWSVVIFSEILLFRFPEIKRQKFFYSFTALSRRFRVQGCWVTVRPESQIQIQVQATTPVSIGKSLL